MVHNILAKTGIPLTKPLHDTTLGEVLITPTRIYANPILQLNRQISINGLAHITGGGIIENLPRILPKELAGLITKILGKCQKFSNGFVPKEI